MHWQISVLGAFDRFNYGDLLFARVAEHMLAQHFDGAEVRYYALRASDLTADGGVLTHPLSELYKTAPPPGVRHLVMLAGGELLAPSWTQMAEHLVHPSLSRQMKRFYSRTGYAIWSPFWRHIYRCRNRQPWTIDPKELPDPDQTDVVYNAVGGTSMRSLSDADRRWQAAALSRASWLTVRDQATADAVVDRGLPEPPIAPDSAVVMRDLLPDERADEIRRQILSAAGLPDEPYLCVQAAERWSRGNEETLCRELKTIQARTGLNVISFSIGRAAGHDDQLTSQKLEARLGDQPWFGVANSACHVDQIMALIGGSQTFVGTSLHGYITAFAYGRGRVGLLSHLTKVRGFRDAWDRPDMPAGVAIEEIAHYVDIALGLQGEDRAQSVAQIYRESFETMVTQLQQAQSGAA